MKKLFALAIALLLCLSACGNKDPGDVVGDDWRVTGVVNAAGSITRDGLDVDVLVCVDTDCADFYYDTAEHVLFDYVDYPVAMEDAAQQFRSIDFADRNGDGDSDVSMLFGPDDKLTLMVWFWDAETEKFVYQAEESQLLSDSGMDERLSGTWCLDGDDTADSVIKIDGTDWTLYERTDGSLTAVDNGALRVTDEAQGHYAADSDVTDGASYILVVGDENGFYWGTPGDYALYMRPDKE